MRYGTVISMPSSWAVFVRILDTVLPFAYCSIITIAIHTLKANNQLTLRCGALTSDYIIWRLGMGPEVLGWGLNDRTARARRA